MSLIRGFQVELRDRGRKSPPSGGKMGNFTEGRFFYQFVGISGGVRLTIQTFSKLKSIQ